MQIQLLYLKMIRLATFTLILFLAFEGFSHRQMQQIKEKDSLLLLIKETEDITEKLTKYKEAVRFFSRTNPTHTLEFAEKGLEYFYRGLHIAGK